MPPSPRETPEVSFVLTVFNKAWAIPAVWDRLKRQEGGPFEFVAVDDCSTDGSQALLSDIARDEPRMRLIRGERNAGPAVRLNQGAREARGRLLYLIDGDDLVPVNGAAWARNALSQAHAALIWGRRRKDAAETIAGPVSERRDALAFAAARPVVHMAGMVERALFLRAGGVFIQDQSTPLRLARAAGRMLWTDAALAGVQAGPATLSANRMQQHHDRYLSARNLLADGVDGAGAEALRRLCGWVDLDVAALPRARCQRPLRPAFVALPRIACRDVAARSSLRWIAMRPACWRSQGVATRPEQAAAGDPADELAPDFSPWSRSDDRARTHAQSGTMTSRRSIRNRSAAEKRSARLRASAPRRSRETRAGAHDALERLSYSVGRKAPRRL